MTSSKLKLLSDNSSFHILKMPIIEFSPFKGIITLDTVKKEAVINTSKGEVRVPRNQIYDLILFLEEAERGLGE